MTCPQCGHPATLIDGVAQCCNLECDQRLVKEEPCER